MWIKKTFNSNNAHQRRFGTVKPVFWALPKVMLQKKTCYTYHLLQRRGVWLLAGVTFLLFTTATYLKNTQMRWKPFQISAYENYRLDELDPLPDTNQSCTLPRIHPFDRSILAYLREPRPIICKIRQGLLTYVNQSGYLVLNRTALEENGYGTLETTSLSCSFRPIIRPPGDDFELILGEKRSLSVYGVKLKDSIVEVSCSNFAGFDVYNYIHAHITPSLNSTNDYVATEDYKIDTESIKEPDKPFNVFFLGIDSVSRLAFIRNLPKTYRYLTEVMGSYVFRGMTKIGDNTFPNLAAILTGKKVGKEIPANGNFDKDWPFIWQDFKRAGYGTLFEEDQPHLGLFTYLRQGLKDPPTDHYLRPFWLSVEKSAVHRLSSSLCYGPTPKHLLQLQHAKDFLYQYNIRSVPSFGFSFISEISHDFLSKVSVADDDFVNWLDDLYSSSLLNRTVLFLFADHGHRFDAIRQTLVGRLEERLPFFSIYVPPELIQNQPHILDNLKINTGRLTSTFDAYYTAMDILQYSILPNYRMGAATSDRGTSLFGPINDKRTCPNAGIPDHYCVCEEEIPLNVNDASATSAAIAILKVLNDLSNSSLCERLTLKSIKRADQIKVSDKVITNVHDYFGKIIEEGSAKSIISKFRIIIETTPGGGIFEATVAYRVDDGDYVVNPDISRINKYGNQSWCEQNPVLRKYCLCKDKQA